MLKGIKKRFIKIGAAVACLALAVTAGALSLKSSTEPISVSADMVTYRTGANAAHSTYKTSKYYKHVTSIELTGDGVTDTLAVALSQLGYSEGSSSDFSGSKGDLGGKTTEYVYNYGDADSSGYKMAWCASFCSWSIYQSQTADHSTHSQSCRNNLGNETYIWRECGCDYWAQQLAKFGKYKTRGSYTPKKGDLIFFDLDGNGWRDHIGFVLWCDGNAVYTVEGNRSNKVVLYRYALTSTDITGYGVLPYPENSSAPKVDYSGRNNTMGQYITTNAALNVSSTKGGSTSFTVPKYTMFNVTGFDGGYAIVEYNGNRGYATLNTSFNGVTSTDTLNTKQVQVSATGDYSIVKVGLYEDGNTTDKQIAFKFLNSESESSSTVDLRFEGSGWRKLDANMAFMSKVRFNGKPIKETYPDAQIYAITNNGLAITNITCNTGDMISIDKGAVFANGDTKMTMAKHFIFTYNGSSFDISTATSDAYIEKALGEYSIVNVGLYGDGNTTDKQIAFKFMNRESESDSLVDLDFEGSGWRKLNEEAFMSKVRFNGKPIKETYPDAQLYAITDNGLAITNITCNTGDMISIDKGAVFTNGRMKMTMTKHFIFTYNGSSYDISTTNSNTYIEKALGEYSIVRVYLYGDGNTTNEQIAFKFLNSESESDSLVDLGYLGGGWTKLNNDAFLSGVKVNGKAIKDVYPDVEFFMITSSGLAIKGLDLQIGDIVVIEEGTVYSNGDIKMTMKHRYAFRYNGTDYDVSDAFLEENENRSYYVIGIAAYNNESSNANQVAFKLLDNADADYTNVNLGYPKKGWTEITTADEFLARIKLNGEPIKDVYPDVKLSALETGSGLALQNLDLKSGDKITIEEGAVFANGNITAKMTQEFTFTFNGTGYDVTTNGADVKEYGIVKTGIIGGGNCTNNQLAVWLYNSDSEGGLSVNFGNGGGWHKQDVNNGFLSYVYKNGKPIKEVCTDIEFYTVENNGIALKNIDMNAGDVITIAEKGVFDNGKVILEMQFRFTFIFDGESYTIVREPASSVDNEGEGDSNIPEQDEEDENTSTNPGQGDNEGENVPVNPDEDSNEGGNEPATPDKDGDKGADENDSGKKKGCRSSIASLGVPAMALAVAVVLKKKRQA